MFVVFLRFSISLNITRFAPSRPTKLIFTLTHGIPTYAHLDNQIIYMQFRCLWLIMYCTCNVWISSKLCGLVRKSQRTDHHFKRCTFFFFIWSRNMILIFTLQSTPQSHHIFNLCKLNAINVVVSIVLKRIHNCNSICRFNSVTKASVKRLTICRIHNQIKSFAWITFLRFFSCWLWSTNKHAHSQSKHVWHVPHVQSGYSYKLNKKKLRIAY